MSLITCRSNVPSGARFLRRNPPNETQYNYVGGTSGAWCVTQMKAICGRPLLAVSHVDVIKGTLGYPPGAAAWVLSGLVRNTRYVSREEAMPRTGNQSRTPMSVNHCAALIAVHRSEEWWKLGHQIRREILDTQIDHLTGGLRYLSRIVRRWQRRRDLSGQFDSVTWFEYESHDSSAFDDLLSAWRATEEWNYVDRECDMRLECTGV